METEVPVAIQTEVAEVAKEVKVAKAVTSLVSGMIAGNANQLPYSLLSQSQYGS